MPCLKSQPLKILFVCSRNKKRSRTAEEIFKGHPQIHARSAGTEPSSRIKITEGLIGWADLILVMEKKHSTILFEKFPEAIASKKVHCLGIPDEFEFMDEGLINMLKAAVTGFVRT